MSTQDWLSLTEIARLWSYETGESAEAIERDLNAWFLDFVERESSQEIGSPGRDGDTTNLLMGLLGGRQLQRETFATYCEEKGYAKPNFWFAGGTEDREPDPPLPPDSPTIAEIQALHGYAPEAGPAQRQYEEASAEQNDGQFQPTQPAHEIGYEAPCPATDRPAPSESPATPEPVGIAETRLAPALVWQAVSEILPYAIARLLTWVHALPPAGGALPGRKATRLAGGLVLGLSLLTAGFVIGQGGTGRSGTGPVVGVPDEFPTALVNSLRSELAAARQTISSLKEKAALETAGPAAETARQELVLAAQTASAHVVLLDRDLDAAQHRIADLEAKAGAAGAEATILAKQLAVARKMHAAVLEKFRVEAEERATNAGMQLAPARSSAAEVTNVTTPSRDAEGRSAATRPEPNATAEFIDVDSLVTNPDRYATRQVVVTGPLLHLLQKYRLQSKSSQRTMIVDVAGIDRAQHYMLQEAIAGAGLIGSVRAQISGEVVRGSAKKFHLVASDLILVE